MGRSGHIISTSVSEVKRIANRAMGSQFSYGGRECQLIGTTAMSDRILHTCCLDRLPEERPGGAVPDPEPEELRRFVSSADMSIKGATDVLAKLLLLLLLRRG